MNSSQVASIVLKVNGEDAAKKIDNLRRRIELAQKAKDRLAGLMGVSLFHCGFAQPLICQFMFAN